MNQSGPKPGAAPKPAPAPGPNHNMPPPHAAVAGGKGAHKSSGAMGRRDPARFPTEPHPAPRSNSPPNLPSPPGQPSRGPTRGRCANPDGRRRVRSSLPFAGVRRQPRLPLVRDPSASPLDRGVARGTTAPGECAGWISRSVERDFSRLRCWLRPSSLRRQLVSTHAQDPSPPWLAPHRACRDLAGGTAAAAKAASLACLSRCQQDSL